MNIKLLEDTKMNKNIKDFNLDLKNSNKENGAHVEVGSRYACTPGSCWKYVCFTTTVK